MFSPLFAPPQPDWPPQTEIVGFSFYDGPKNDVHSARLEDFLAAGDPPIVFTLGSAAVFNAGNFYHESARAASLLNRRAILLLGQNPPPENCPANVACFDYLPYSQVFPRAAAIVHQGGIGTTAQALRAGRPMLVLPFAFDQPDNAFRLVQLGVARQITYRQYTAPRIAAQLNQLLSNPSYQQHAATFSSRLKSESGPQSVSIALERLLIQTPPV